MSYDKVKCSFCFAEVPRCLLKSHESVKCPLRQSYKLTKEKFSDNDSSLSTLPGCSVTGPTDFGHVQLAASSPQSSNSRKCPYCNLQSSTYSASRRHEAMGCPCKPTTVSPFKTVTDAEEDTFGSVQSDEIQYESTGVRRVLTFDIEPQVDAYSDGDISEEPLTAIPQDDSFGDLESEYEESDFGDIEESIDISGVGSESNLYNWVFALCLYLLLFQFGNYISHGAISNLLWNFSEFLKLLVQNRPELAIISALFPPSIYQLYKFVGLNADEFCIYAVCPKCEETYLIDDVPENFSCSCGTKLGKKTKNSFKPFYSYCVMPVQDALQTFVLKSGFEENCDSWRSHQANSSSETLFDICDGRIWKDKMRQFIEQPNNYAFMLNLDWFQPYKRSQVSIGAIYLVCLNLPRNLRFKEENIILLALMPWLEREPKCLDGFLRPIVNDFLTLWEGKTISTFRNPDGVLVRGALLGTSSDMPATRKLNGFMACSGKKGCSKCTISLVSRKTSNYRDYGKTFDAIQIANLDPLKRGVRKLPWQMRSVEAHRRELKKNKSDEGYKTTDLLRLPYFDTVRFHCVDVMHALYEGVAKRVFETWVKEGRFGDKEFGILDKEIASIRVPPDFDRIPAKMGSSFRSFKAVQWMHFVIHYSPLILSGKFLPKNHLNYWSDFVAACRSITKTEVTAADAAQFTFLFCKFAKEFKKIHGDDAVTPNFHLCLHIEQCILDYGPVYSFWLFSFERYNGLLGKYPVNGHNDAQVQMMRRFYLYSHVAKKASNLTLNGSVFDFIFAKNKKPFASKAVNQQNLWRIRKFAQNPSCDMMTNFFTDLTPYNLPSRSRKAKLPERNMKLMLESYQTMYPNHGITLDNISNIVQFFNSVTVGSDHYFCSRFGEKDAYVLANYCPLGNSNIECAYVGRFMLHDLVLNSGQIKKHLFVVVTWYSRIKLLDGNFYQGPFIQPVVVCNMRDIIASGACTYVPIQRVICRCLCIVDPSCASYRGLMPCISNCA